MNFARIALAAVVAWLVSIPVGSLANDVVLSGLLAANAAALRPEAAMTARLPIGFAAQLLGFFVFAYMYAKGYEGEPGIIEGARFGVLVGLLVNCFGIVWNYVVMPISGSLEVGLMAEALIEPIVYGAVIGAIYTPLPKRTAERAAI